ncbi:PqqD family protein [Streptomyces sp. NPDC008313]|uniref:PqqD family protein n=1 Tax=Streptomyces sp. NPDC008313 TaxID=3364826 RepID=UPI0036E64D39
MRVRPAPGVTATVLESGELLLFAADRGDEYTCGPVATAMWIALRRHDGDLDATADTLAGLWDSERVIIRAELEIWADELRAAGLVRRTP